ncbi:MAG TPA: DNA polymerase I [Bacillota bacterium]|jgi:DNA polymerase-1|nr:DNA polymerase I [Bacillota bacterium]HOL08732.1 DNA polymerase I [Bacillota bacterium]HPO96365.1 DNA polymerase I [Bacillota bacterium]
MSKKLIIIDGYSLANRAFFALPLLTTKEGQVTNAVYGMAMMLIKLLEEAKPDYLITAFDVAAPTFRHQDYQAYKANRSKMDDNLRTQLPLIRQLLEIMRIPIYEQAGYEADDIIGTIACKGAAQKINVEIVTGDRDSFQLVGPYVTVLYTKKGITEVERVDEEYIQKRYQLTARQLIDLKGIMGDASDNIPGIPGFGEKTALKYLLEYGSIDGIYHNIDRIARERDRELFVKYQEQALLSRHLAEIKVDLDIDLDLDNCCRHFEIDHQQLIDFCKKYEFKSLLKKLEQNDGAGKEVDAVTSYEELKTEVQIVSSDNIDSILTGIKELVSQNKYCYIQLVTNTATKLNSSLLGLAIGCEDRQWYFNLKTNLRPTVLMELLADEAITKYGHDLKKQLYIAYQNNIIIDGKLEDSLLAGYLLNAGIGDLELESLIEKYLQKSLPEFKSDKGTRLSIFEIPDKVDAVDLIAKVAGTRLAGMKLLFNEFSKLLKEQNLDKLYYDVEIPLLKVLFQMECEGIKISPQILSELGVVLKKRQQELEAEIFDLAGEPFNISSPKQLGVILFEKLGLTAPKKTKTGYSTDANVLEGLIASHPIIKLILEYRQNLKLQSTYIDSLIGLINPKTNRVHTTFNQAVTTTGRLSSTEPNLQNIPIRTEEGRVIRQAFIPEEGFKLLAADYSQIELRVMAHFSQDEAYIDAFLKGEDIHRYTAAAVYEVPLSEVTREMRDQAKAVNFGIIYGISGFGLAQNIGITRKEADQFIKAYFNKYPKVKKYVDQLIEEARERGESRTLLGRIRKLPDLHSRNFTLRSFAERMARNTPIQGTAADIIKIAMVKIFEHLKERPELGRLLLQVHDELVFEVPENNWPTLAAIIKQEMESAVSLNVPLVVDLKLGSDWGTMNPVKLEE